MKGHPPMAATPSPMGFDLRRVLRPGRPPRAWVLRAGTVLALVLGADLLLVYLGVRFHGNPHRYFAEWRPATYLSFALFVGASLACGSVQKRASGAAARFWLLYGWALFYLGLDDLLRIHEHIDFGIHRLMGWDPFDPVTDKLDGLIVAGYGAAVAGLWLVHRRYLLRLPWLIYSTALAFVCFAAMVVLDLNEAEDAPEESCKLFGVTFILIGVLGAAFDPAVRGEGGDAGLESERGTTQQSKGRSMSR